MKLYETDLMIVGAGPVGLMCSYLARMCGLRTVTVDRSDGPLKTGRADALNARTLQLLELAGLFRDLYPLGKVCDTSSVWAGGRFVSRQSSWWRALEGCFHRHFLMLGQSHVEKVLDGRLTRLHAGVKWGTQVEKTEVLEDACITTLETGEQIKSRFVIGADGSRSFIRNHFQIPFPVIRPEMIWAVIDGVIDSDFPRVPEIIVFQTDTSDVAWIPREGELDRFYVRMDKHSFTQEDAVAKINRAVKPYKVKFRHTEWFSRFSVKESVAEKYFVHDRVFLAGDACHIHSVNGGQGLNTGLADAFNLIWKINMVIQHGFPFDLLYSYEKERQPVARSVIETSGELVRSTRDSEAGTHARDYVKIVEKRSGNITGMGIRYGSKGHPGTRLPDFKIERAGDESRIYSQLDFRKFTLLLFGNAANHDPVLPDFFRVVRIMKEPSQKAWRAAQAPFKNQAVLVRPDSYIDAVFSSEDWVKSLTDDSSHPDGEESLMSPYFARYQGRTIT